MNLYSKNIAISIINIIILTASSGISAVTSNNTEKGGLKSTFLIGALSGYNNNLFLDTTNQKAVYVQRIVPHFDLDYKFDRFAVNLDYTGDYSFYSKGGERLENLLQYSRMSAGWGWHRDFTLQVFSDASDHPIDLSKGGGISSSYLRLGDSFQPPAVNSVFITAYGANQLYSRQINSRAYLEMSYSVTNLDAKNKKYARDVFYHGPSGQMLYTWNKRVDTALKGSLTMQDYKEGFRREIGQYIIETTYSITPRLNLQAGLGIERLNIRNSNKVAFRKSNLFLDANLGFEKIPRTKIKIDYKKRFFSDIQARVFRVEELGVNLSHDLSRRLVLSYAMFSRNLTLLQTDLDIKDWIMGLEWQVRYTITKDIQPVVNIDYVINRGKVKINDFDNLRVTTGFRYYFFSLN